MAASWRELIRHGCIDIAHRGARSLAPENTLAAAKRALLGGAHAWELDVRMTSDRELIVVHDGTLDRTSNAPEKFPGRGPWNVRDFTLDEFRTLDFGSWFNKSDPFGQIGQGIVTEDEMELYRGEPAPTLAEALAFTAENGWFVNVEIKDLEGSPEHDAIAESVGILIKRMGLEGRVLVSSFNHGYLERIKRVTERIPTGVLVNGPHTRPADLMRRLEALTYHPRASAFRPVHLEELSRLGYGIMVWTVNNKRLMRFFAKAGVHGIFSDFPQRLHLVLEELRK